MRFRHRHLNAGHLGAAMCLDARFLSQAAGAVASWTDRTANGNSPAQGTGSKQPTLTEGSIRGQRAVVFDGSDDALTLASVSLLQNVTGAWLIAAAAMTGGDAYRAIVGSYTPGGSVARQVVFGRSTPGLEAGGRRLTSNSYQFVAVSWTTSSPAIVEGRFDAANATLDVGLDGTLTARSGGWQTAGNTDNTASTINLGASGPTLASERLAGSVGAATIFASIPSLAIQKRVRHSMAYSWRLQSA